MLKVKVTSLGNEKTPKRGHYASSQVQTSCHNNAQVSRNCVCVYIDPKVLNMIMFMMMPYRDKVATVLSFGPGVIVRLTIMNRGWVPLLGFNRLGLSFNRLGRFFRLWWCNILWVWSLVLSWWRAVWIFSTSKQIV